MDGFCWFKQKDVINQTFNGTLNLLLEVFMSIVCEHGSLKRSCEICERDAEIDRLRADKWELVEACERAIPCLEDWIHTTGFGAVNRRDRSALSFIKAAIEKHKEGMWKK